MYNGIHPQKLLCADSALNLIERRRIRRPTTSLSRSSPTAVCSVTGVIDWRVNQRVAVAAAAAAAAAAEDSAYDTAVMPTCGIAV